MNSLLPNQFVIANTVGVPLNPITHAKCDPYDSAMWLSYTDALNICRVGEYPAFVFTYNDPYFVIDLDKCYVNNNWSAFAASIVSRFPHSYVEISKSMTGLHIIGRYQYEYPHKCKNAKIGMELYTGKRILAVTGISAVGNPNVVVDDTLKYIIDTYMAPPTLRNPVASEPTNMSDTEVISRGMSSKSGGAAFGDRAGFKDLWEENIDILRTTYPPHKDTPYDYSSADAALCQHLAFWTGRNAEQMERIFNQSALGKRDKWRVREDYRISTINHAVQTCTTIYSLNPVNAPTPVVTENTGNESGLTVKTGYQLFTPEQQIELFDGCTYIASIHKILTPNGVLMKPDVFKAMFGGKVFMIDSVGNKTSTNAWTAFTENQAIDFPTAHSVCFRPDMPPNKIITDEQWDTVNYYVPINTLQQDGDISPFLNHINEMLPNERDANILLSYMAAVVQYPGEKFQWAPLLQGYKGNGKTLAIRALEYAIGKRYTHLPNAQDLTQNKFNWWLFGKLFIGVEEIRVADKWELLNTLKPYITNDRMEIQGKGQDQITSDNRANFLFCSNYKDGLPVDRRYCPLFTAQQSEADIITHGWKNTPYFVDLYAWAKKQNGYAIINKWLRTFNIPPEFNPTGLCHWAPDTSSTSAATQITRSRVEQEITEALDEGLPGFKNGWVSSKMLGVLLENKRLRVSLNKRTDLLENLGYIRHPALPGGRSTVNILQEGCRPRLYVHKDRGDILSIGENHVIAEYKKAQEYAV